MSRKLTAFGVFAAVVALAFGGVLRAWVGVAWGHDQLSYTLLVPFVSGYLIWIRREELSETGRPAYGLTAGFLVLAGVLLGAYWQSSRAGAAWVEVDVLAVEMVAFWSVVLAGAAVFFGAEQLRRFAFPLAFLFFSVPLPRFFSDWLSVQLQLGSAEVSNVLLSLSGMPLVRTGPTLFDLPGFRMRVAPECSGIHSTLVLFIVSTVAGYLLLRTVRSRILLTLAVIPLALLRNALRIFTIAQLCVQISPDMADSYIHHKGGPIFFALSLIPFFALLLFLRKREGQPLPDVPLEIVHAK